MNNDQLSNWVKTKYGAFVSLDAKIYEPCFIGENTVLEERVIVGKPYREILRQSLLNISKKKSDLPPTYIGKNCHIHSNCIIYSGSRIGNNVICKDFTLVGTRTTVGENTKIQYNAQINHNVLIGKNCRVAGFCCNESIIGDGSTMYGSLVHHYSQHAINTIKGAPKIGKNVVIAFNSTIIGGITINDGAYIAAGAIVSKDIPPKSIVTAINKTIPIKEWNGRLKNLRNQ